MFHYILYALAMIMLSLITCRGASDNVVVMDLAVADYIIAGSLMVVLGIVLKLSIKKDSEFGPIYGIMRILTALLSTSLLLTAMYVSGLALFLAIDLRIEAGVMAAPGLLFLPDVWYWVFAVLFGIIGGVVHYWHVKDGDYVVWRFRNEARSQVKTRLHTDFR